MFGGGSSQVKPAEIIQPPVPPPEALAAPNRQLRVIQAPLLEGTPFDQFLTLLGQPAPQPSVLTQAEADGDTELLKAVRLHFEKNKPAPSSLPAASLQVLNAITNPDLSLGELSRLVAQDAAMAAAILKVANSAAYAAAQEIQTLRDAVTRLGLTEVGRVAGTVAARSLFQPKVRSEFASFSSRWSELFAESVASARAAAWQAMKVKGARSDHAFVAGMLHDLGRTVGLRSIAAVILGERNEPQLEVTDSRVDRVLEAIHVEVGGEVHAEWRLPRFPTLVAMRHHELGLPTDNEFVDLHVVRLTSALVQFRRHATWRGVEIREEINESAKALGVDAYGLRSLDTQIRDELLNAERTFGEKPKRRAG